MKRKMQIIFLIVCLLGMSALSACGNAQKEEGASKPDASKDELAADTPGTSEGADSSKGETEEESSDASDDAVARADGIDIDLTTHSSTMRYAEIYNMMLNPQDYQGKIIKMRGEVSSYYSEEEQRNRYGCLIKDASACCSQGIEFYLSDAYLYPEDYPENGDYCSIVGTFDVREKGNFLYISLRDAEIVEQ